MWIYSHLRRSPPAFAELTAQGPEESVQAGVVTNLDNIYLIPAELLLGEVGRVRTTR